MPPQQPFIPTVDPNSNIGRMLMERERRLAASPQARADAMPSLDGMTDTNDPRFQELLRQQQAALGPPPAALLPGGGARSERGTPFDAVPGATTAAGANPFRDGTGVASPPNPTPEALAAGQTALAPVPTQDPFRVLPARQSRDRTLSDGSILPGEFFGPGMAGMTGNGFQPGLMQIGGMTTAANDPAAYLMGLQQQARINGLNPQFTAEQFLGSLNAGADRSARSGVAAQAGNVNLATGRMQADAQRYSADRTADGTARAAALGAIPGFVAGLGAGNIPAPIAEMIGGHITRAIQGGGGGGGTPFGGPMGPGGPAPAAAPGVASGGPGVPAAGSSPGNPFAAVAASGDFLRPLAGVFGTRNAQGVFTTPEGFNVDTAAAQFLDRFHTGTPEQRAAAVAAVERGDLGNPDQLMRAIAKHYAVSTMRTEGASIAPGNPGWANMIMQSPIGPPLAWLHGGSAVPAQRVMPLPNGQPFATFGNDPRQNTLSSTVGVVTSGGVPFTRATIPGFDPVDFDRTAVNSFFNRNNSTAERDRRLREAAQGFLSSTTRYRNATAGQR